MSLGFSKFGSWIVLLWFAASGLAVSHVRAQGSQGPRRSIELSETNSAEILTNLNQLTNTKDGFRQLDDQLRSLKGLSTRNSIEGGFSLPYVQPTVSALPSKTIKEFIERKKNWSLTPEELGTAASSSDSDALSGFGEDKRDGKSSSLQQFYDNLNRTAAKRKSGDGFSDNSSGKHSDSRQGIASEDDSNLPAGIKDSAQKLKELVSDDNASIFSPTRGRTSFDNFFGLDGNHSTREAVGAPGPKTSMESFMDQFKKAMDGPSATSPLDPALQALMPETGTRQPASYPPLGPLPSLPHHEVTRTTPGNVNSVLNRTAVVPDINAAVLNQWNPMYAPPKLELPKYSPPTPLNVDFPRRRF